MVYLEGFIQKTLQTWINWQKEHYGLTPMNNSLLDGDFGIQKSQKEMIVQQTFDYLSY